jgi:hypothetical protein
MLSGGILAKGKRIIMRERKRLQRLRRMEKEARRMKNAGQ